MALQAMKSGGGAMNSKAAKVAIGFAEGGPAGAAMALSDNPNMAMARKLLSAGGGGAGGAVGGVADEVPVNPQGLGREFAPSQQYGLGVDTSMPGAPAAPQGAIGRRFSLLGGSK